MPRGQMLSGINNWGGRSCQAMLHDLFRIALCSKWGQFREKTSIVARYVSSAIADGDRRQSSMRF